MRRGRARPCLAPVRTTTLRTPHKRRRGTREGHSYEGATYVLLYACSNISWNSIVPWSSMLTTDIETGCSIS
jgi:hypothetical protein